jgi:hypothetical protein
MPIVHRYAHASGVSLTDCTWIGLRWDNHYGFDFRKMESWILTPPAPGSQVPTPIICRPGRMTELWRSPGGTSYVPTFSGEVHIVHPTPRASGERVRTEKLGGVLSGAWGLSDEMVMVFGEDGWIGPGQPRYVMYLWDGARWRSIPSPGHVNGLGGSAPDLVYAVGKRGLIARWDGGRWERAHSPTTATLSRVLVVDESEIYAAGPGRRILQGSIYGWVEIATAPFDVHGLARADGAVWVSSAHEGLFRLDGAELVPAKASVAAEQLDARGASILATTNQAIVEVRGDQEVARVEGGGFVWLTEREPLSFRAGR